MTVFSNDPSWWPTIHSDLIYAYFAVAASAGVIYDWTLTFGQEVELVWRQRWSLVTVLYLSVRYGGILCAVANILASVPTISLTDVGCHVMFVAIDWMSFVVNALVSVILITRLYAMYQRSIKALIPLVLLFLAVSITNGVIAAISMRVISAEEFVLSGTYQCSFDYGGDVLLLDTISWILGTVWEVFALCLAVWIAVKHFRELQQQSGGRIIENCLTVLIKSHMGYFGSYLATSCFNLGHFSPAISGNPYSTGSQIYAGVAQILLSVQMYVLGPRLVLSIREYHAKLVADSDAATAMTSIAFQERVYVSTSSTV